jgi:hypothetical protein
MDFINDLNKEIIKDVIGSFIFYFPISEVKTKVHDVYRESPDKIFENPIKIDCRVVWQQPDVTTNGFGHEKKWKIEAFVPARDMIQRGISLVPGDFFSYDTIFYEVIAVTETHNIFGQTEYVGGLKISGRFSRKENFVAKIFGPTSEAYSDPDAVQEEFVQQRGFEENKEGVTGDVRDLQRRGVLETPISGKPSEISILASLSGSAGSAFYDEP